MNDEQATRLLHRLADQVSVGPAPVGEVLRDAASIHRKRQRFVLAAAAAVLVVPVGAVVLVQSLGNGEGGAAPASTPAIPQPPEGTRLVGMGNIAVAVPAAWGTNDVKCGVPLRDTVYFATDGVRSCFVNYSREASALRIASASSSSGREATRATDTDATINGVPVRLSPVTCTTSDPVGCNQTIFVPEEDVVFTAQAPAGKEDVIDGIRQSLQRLPGGYTTVPYEPNGPVSDTVALLRDVGFEVRIVKEHRPSLTPGLLFGSKPALGSVVAEHSTVTLTVSSGDYPTTPDGRSYGTLPASGKELSLDQLPDLVRVVGDNGVEGYAETKLVLGRGPEPSSPQEALERQRNGPDSETVPVYAKDGTTIVDTYTITDPNADGELPDGPEGD